MPPVVEIIPPRKNHNQVPVWLKVSLGVAGVGCIALFTYAGFAYYKQVNQPCDTDCIGDASYTATPKNSATPIPTATPATAQAMLDGTTVERGSENLHPLAVMIENHPDARPQSGLGSAGLVYEAIAEGGITRFMAVFTDPRKAIKVGPVRSARTYYVDYATELNAFYGHVGGNMDALDQIKATGVLDLDQFALGSAAYHREPRAGIATEHTMYSSTELLWKYATEQKKWSQQADFDPWVFQADLDHAQRPASHSVQVKFSERQYQVDWQYDPATNLYSRSLAGTAHKDADTGKVITAKNIVLQTVDRKTTTTRIGENGWIYTTKGSGKAVIIQNGAAIAATWKKEGNSRTRYYDANGKEIAFVAGPTWVELVHPDTPTTY